MPKIGSGKLKFGGGLVGTFSVECLWTLRGNGANIRVVDQSLLAEVLRLTRSIDRCEMVETE